MKRALLIAAVCAPLLAACATAKPRVAQTALPPTFEAPARGAALPAATLDTWWTLYNDAQLTALIDEALGRNFDVRTAAARLEQARATRESQQRQLYFPTGALTAGVTRSQNGAAQVGAGAAALTSQALGDANIYTANFDVSWELDLFGRRRNGERIANADLRTAEFTYEATRWSMAANIADSLFQARGLAVQLAEAQETLRIQRALYDAAKAKADHGLVATSDAAQTQANVQSTQAQAEALQAQLNAARRTLLLLLGRATDPLGALTVDAALASPPPAPVTIPGELLARRPDVREAEWRLASAAGVLTNAQLDLFPKFTLSPGYGVTMIDGFDPNGAWSVGGSVNIPVLDIPRLLAQIRVQKAVSEQQVLAYEKAVQTAYSEAETSLANLDSENRRVTLLTAAERNASVAYEAKRIGYSRGFNDLQTTLTAENAWRQARSSLASAQATAMQRSVQVFKAVGGGWTSTAPGRDLPPAPDQGRGGRGG